MVTSFASLPQVGLASQNFIKTHVTAHGRACYLKKLFEEIKKLQRFEPKLEEFADVRSWRSEYERENMKVVRFDNIGGG